MKDIKWYLNRIAAMNLKEITWRVQQKYLQKQENKFYFNKHIPVTEAHLPMKISDLQPNRDCISINWSNDYYSCFDTLNIFDSYDYLIYKKQWNAGFQTANKWPEDIFSYEIPYSQREDIGDIRTNWELNRHFQFAVLAKSFYITGDSAYYDELLDLFNDWNKHNLFLHGVEWISVMEIAIRVNSWIYMYCYLDKAFEKHSIKVDSKFLKQISHGILVMTDHITKHYARFSSANNHLIVEMYAVALSGIFYRYAPWKNFAFTVLSEQLPIQNYSDGVNKEMSLHYQSFVMEAYGLLMTHMNHNGIVIPGIWVKYLNKMSEFLCDCCGDYGETIVFGDNDEGRILDLSGKSFDYYRYVLDLMGCVLPCRYSKLTDDFENIRWSLSKSALQESRMKKIYHSSEAKCYREGGYTILRSRNHKILIGIDHADLGFSPLAAHGHADALSFQMYVEGIPVFVDPGTYNYHVPKENRNVFRATYNHNTVCIDQRNQSEILGPFLWGKRAKCVLKKFELTETRVILEVEAGYGLVCHDRSFIYDYNNRLVIKDFVTVPDKNLPIEHVFVLHPSFSREANDDNKIVFYRNGIELEINSISNATVAYTEYDYSEHYGSKETGPKIVFRNLNPDEGICMNIEIWSKKEHENCCNKKN